MKDILRIAEEIVYRKEEEVDKPPFVKLMETCGGLTKKVNFEWNEDDYEHS